MHTEVTAGLILKLNKSLFKNFPGKYVNTHGSQITSGLSGFLFEIEDLLVFIGDNKTKSGRIFPSYRVCSQSDISFVLFVEIKKNLVIHLIYMVTAEDENILRIIKLNELKILIYGISSTCVPLSIITLLIGRKNADTSDIPVKVPRNTNTDMSIQP